MKREMGISGLPSASAGETVAMGEARAASEAVAAGAARATGGAVAAGAVRVTGGAVAAGAARAAGGAGQGADDLAAWLAKYEPVERAVIEAHERRISNRFHRRAEAARAFAGLCEATEGLAVVWRREGWSVREMVRWADGDVLTLLTLAKWLRRDATRYIDRAQSRLRRPLYYAQERARREALARERRRVGGRRTTNPCPTREEILDAWVHRRDSHEAAVRFGSLVHDLECYVDNSLLRDESGAIVGRRGGVKAWLQVNIPALYLRYTTVMRYKALAKKLRQVTGLADPVPAAAVLAGPEQGDETVGGGMRDYGAYEISRRQRGRRADGTADVDSVTRGRADGAASGERVDSATSGGRENGAASGLVVARKETRVPESAVMRKVGAVPELAVVRARAVWLEVIDGVRGSATALMERLDALTDSERVEEAHMLAGWRAKYENEITERMKSRWWRKMARKREVG